MSRNIRGHIENTIPDSIWVVSTELWSYTMNAMHDTTLLSRLILPLARAPFPAALTPAMRNGWIIFLFSFPGFFIHFAAIEQQVSTVSHNACCCKTLRSQATSNEHHHLYSSPSAHAAVKASMRCVRISELRPGTVPNTLAQKVSAGSPPTKDSTVSRLEASHIQNNKIFKNLHILYNQRCVHHFPRFENIDLLSNYYLPGSPRSVTAS